MYNMSNLSITDPNTDINKTFENCTVTLVFRPFESHIFVMSSFAMSF